MTIRDVLLLGNPKLREKSKIVSSFDKNLNNKIGDLKETLKYLQETKSLGRALAAPQIGYQERFIAFALPEKEFDELITPEAVCRLGN